MANNSWWNAINAIQSEIVSFIGAALGREVGRVAVMFSAPQVRRPPKEKVGIPMKKASRRNREAFCCNDDCRRGQD